VLKRQYTAAALLLLACASARAETVTCTEITTVPYTISKPGAYCLAGHVSRSLSSGAAISINASDVRLDCNDFALINTSSAGTAAGILSAARNNVVVENCRIKGFHQGIRFDAKSSDVVVRNNVVQKARYIGILVWASRAQVMGNTVVDLVSASTATSYAQGIYVAPYSSASTSTSQNVVVQGNRVLGMSGTTSIQGIRIDLAEAPLVADNYVGSLTPKAGGKAYGIMINDSGRAIVRGNTVASTQGVNLVALGLATVNGSICLGNSLAGAQSFGLGSCSYSKGNIYK